MVFEELRGGFMRLRTNDREGSHLVAYIVDTALSDLLGLAERSTHADNRALVLFDPCLPRSNSITFLYLAESTVPQVVALQTELENIDQVANILPMRHSDLFFDFNRHIESTRAP